MVNEIADALRFTEEVAQQQTTLLMSKSAYLLYVKNCTLWLLAPYLSNTYHFIPITSYYPQLSTYNLQPTTSYYPFIN